MLASAATLADPVASPHVSRPGPSLRATVGEGVSDNGIAFRFGLEFVAFLGPTIWGGARVAYGVDEPPLFAEIRREMPIVDGRVGAATMFGPAALMFGVGAGGTHVEFAPSSCSVASCPATPVPQPAPHFSLIGSVERTVFLHVRRLVLSATIRGEQWRDGRVATANIGVGVVLYKPDRAP